MIRVQIDQPPVERTVTITMSESEARELYDFCGQISVGEYEGSKRIMGPYITKPYDKKTTGNGWQWMDNNDKLWRALRAALD